MPILYHRNYEKMADQQLVELILAVPHNEEAAAYLLYERYYNMLQGVYYNVLKSLYGEDTKCNMWRDDCISEIFIYLRGIHGDWHAFSTFEWRCQFSTWLSGVVYNKMLDILPRLIEKGNNFLSINPDDDDVEQDKPVVQLPDGGEDDYERREQKVLLLEAIGQLKDDDQRFIILKRLQGYNSKEIATLLQYKWQKHGIKKYNNKKELVVPDAAYVDVRTQRAKENLKKIIIQLT